MSLKYLALAAAIVATAMLALGASTATSSGSTQPQSTNETKQIGTLTVRFTVSRFVKRGGRLYAIGAAIAQFQPSADAPKDVTAGSARKAFVAPVKGFRRFSSAQKICPILDLTLGPLDLSLFGVSVHLDKVHLTITADSEGGVLGSLFCSLAGAKVKLAKSAARLTRAVHRSGLATKGAKMAVPIYQKSSGSNSTSSTTSGAKSPMRI